MPSGKFFSRSLAVAISLFGLFLFFNYFLLPGAGAILVHEDPIAVSDAILVLGGGKEERIDQGLELYARGYADMILFTGQDRPSKFAHKRNWALEAQVVALRRGVPADKIELIVDSTSTYDDAVLSKAFCVKHNIRSLIIVSEPYHTKRAYYTFKKEYSGSGIRTMIYPVRDSWYKIRGWWLTKEGIRETVNEYVKLVYYLFRNRI